MTMQSRAVRAGGLHLLLLMGLSGCGATAVTAPAGAEAEPLATPTSALEPVPNDGDGSATADLSVTVSAEEGSGIPPGVPDEDSPAYELLINRLCEKLAGSDCDSLMLEGLGGGVNGEPRRFGAVYDYGCSGGWVEVEWTEQPDGSWDEREVGREEGASAPNSQRKLLPEIAKVARTPSDAEVAAAKVELERQGFSSDDDVEFIDLNHDGQTEFIFWHDGPCMTTVPTIFTRGADGQWTGDDDWTAYYPQPEWHSQE
jgi:hypothetical protein